MPTFIMFFFALGAIIVSIVSGCFDLSIIDVCNKLANDGKRVISPKKERSGLLDYLLGDAKQTASSWFQPKPAYRWQWKK